MRPSITITLSETALETSTPEFLRLDEGTFIFENLELRFQLPPQVRQHWSLFSVNQAKQITLIDTSITLFPDSDAASVAMQDIAVFNILSPPPFTATDEDNIQSPLAIDFSNVFVRGSLTLLNNPLQAPFHLRWINGIFASDNWLYTQRFLDTKPPDILVSLDSVTAFCGTGVVRVTDESGMATGVIQLELYDSILTTELGTPLFLVQQPSLDVGMPLTIKGANFAIDNTSVLLERRSPIDLNLTSQITVGELLSQLQSNTAPAWFQVQRLTENPNWTNGQAPTPDIPLFQMGIQDFAVENYSESALGVDADSLEILSQSP